MEINSSMEIIDSRQVIDRINELEDDRVQYSDAVADVEDQIHELKERINELGDDEESDDWKTLHNRLDDLEFDLESAINDLDEWDRDYGDELKNLSRLEDDASCSDWRYGLTLIREDHFTDYIRDYAEECGDVSPHMPWYIAIDWEATAENRKSDYSSVEFDGETYFYISY